LKLTRFFNSNYAALTFSVPTAHDAPTSLQAFTEEELMLKDTGKEISL
jgi:hypothetical protein